VLLFSSKDKRRKEAEGCLTKIINNNSPTVGGARVDERGDWRLNVTLAVYVIPVHNKVLDVAAAFATVTKELSSRGLSVVVTHKLEVPEIVVAVKWGENISYLRGQVRHQAPLGAGLWHCGVQVTEAIASGEYPQFASLTF
jgi:hypothetical protein